MRIAKTVAAVMLLVSCSLGTNYYVDAVNGRDGNNGSSPSAAWNSIAKVSGTTFMAGDTVRFARGCSWSGNLDLHGSGNSTRPIVFGAYGTGNAPRFSNPGKNAIRLYGSYTVVDSLFLTDAANSDATVSYENWGAMLVTPNATHSVIRNCEFTAVGLGLGVRGPHSLVENNYFHDLVLIYDRANESYGAVGLSVKTSHVEVTGNRFVNCKHAGRAYGYDGGAIEIEGFDAVKTDINIHHNVSLGCMGFLEVTETRTTHVTLAYNLSDDYQQFIAWDTTTEPDSFKVVNNTVIRRYRENACAAFAIFYYRENGPYPDDSWVSITNNIFYMVHTTVLYSHLNPYDFPHDHNLFYSPYTANPIGFAPRTGDIIAEPKFVQFGSDYRLQAQSPAVDKGVDMGYTVDLAGNPVPSGGIVDMGAYEYTPPIAVGPEGTSARSGVVSISETAQPVMVDILGRRVAVKDVSRSGVVSQIRGHGFAIVIGSRGVSPFALRSTTHPGESSAR